MTSNGVEFGPHDESSDPLAEMMSNFDTAHAEFLAATSTWTRSPSEANLYKINETGTQTGLLFSKAMELIVSAEDMEPPEKVRIAIQFLLLTDRERVDRFKKIAPVGIFEPILNDPEDLIENIVSVWENAENPEDKVCQAMLGHYVGGLNKDLSALIDVTNSSPAMRRRERLEGLKRHSYDIGKIAAGVTIGLLTAETIDRYLKRNPR